MERKLIATIEIYLNPHTHGQGSRSSTKLPGNRWQVELDPATDAKNFATLNVHPEAQRSFETILAHELGHIVAQIANDPTHADINLMTNNLVPGETRAWAIAKDISPTLATEMRDAVLDQYKRMGY